MSGAVVAGFLLAGAASAEGPLSTPASVFSGPAGINPGIDSHDRPMAEHPDPTGKTLCVTQDLDSKFLNPKHLPVCPNNLAPSPRVAPDFDMTPPAAPGTQRRDLNNAR